MKTYATNLQFSGYPLKVVEDRDVSCIEHPSKIIKLNPQQKLITTGSTVNDPAQWDAAWFSNYE